SRPAIFDHKVPALNVAGLVQTAPEAGQPNSIGLRRPEVQIADHRQCWLLRARRERPCCRPATEQRDELAPSHSITSSAKAISLSGILRPRALAVVRLITSSNLVGCTTGRSAGLAPLRILPT